MKLPIVSLIALAVAVPSAMAAPVVEQQDSLSKPTFIRSGTLIRSLESSSESKHALSSEIREMYLRRRKATNHAAVISKASGPALPAGVEPSAGCKECKSSLSFAGAEAKKYAVGTQIPTLPFKTKNSWAGNIAVSGPGFSKDSALYFWLWGKDDKEAGDDLVIWLNGGPGCSSLGGMVQENGPFLYESVKEKPYANPYSWTRAANILYVEQPVGVGFTKGSAKLTNEKQIAEEFASFLDNFYKAFPELSKKKLWITGESYAGMYIPYISNLLYTRGTTPQLQGAIIIDGTFTNIINQEEPVAYQYAVQHKEELKLTDSDVAKIKAEADKCGLADYPDKNLHYPPKGRLPDYPKTCSPFNVMYNLASERSSTFNVYNIDVPDPMTDSPLGNPNGGDAQYTHKTFFDNYDLQKYIHAPHKKWIECAVVFPNDDQSTFPDETPNYDKSIMANVIEKSKKFIVLNGNLDALVITNGTALALQNLTWNGAQGFSKPPLTPLYDVDGKQGGTMTEERGLIYAEVPRSGHMIPGDAPATGLAALLKLIGARDWSHK